MLYIVYMNMIHIIWYCIPVVLLESYSKTSGARYRLVPTFIGSELAKFVIIMHISIINLLSFAYLILKRGKKTTFLWNFNFLHFF